MMQIQLDSWCSQDEQVTWAHHGHIQCMPNTQLLGEMGRAPTMKSFEIIHPEVAVPFFQALPVCSLHVHMKVITHAYNWSLTLAFHIIFTRAPVNFMWAQAWLWQV